MSEPRVFWLHEDEWGMIDILPAENFASALQTAHEAEEFGKAHFDGFGWTDMFVIPEAKAQLAQRNMPLSEIRTLTRGYLPAADRVESGIRPGEINCDNGSFAFAEEDKGALYGEEREGVVQYLCMLPPERVDEASMTFWTSALIMLGTTHHLMLADWWDKRLIDLSDRDAIVRYLHGTRYLLRHQ
ncbi:MAG TPA: hypothetical protein VIG30_06465 [Ktedonobacterales bacterium]|jgi:hypothetical protein